MRRALLSLLPLMFSGCACFIAGAGRDLRSATTREEMHRILGKPIAEGKEDGDPYEEFWYRGKLKEESRAAVLNMGSAMTGCIFEPILLPVETCRALKSMVWGQRVRIVYWQDGKRFLAKVGGYHLYLGTPWPPPHDPVTPPPPTSATPSLAASSSTAPRPAVAP